MLDNLDPLFDVVALIFWLLILVTVIITIVWLGALPGKIARGRGHSHVDAVNALGWVGLLFLPLWPLALTWAFFPSGRISIPTGAKS